MSISFAYNYLIVYIAFSLSFSASPRLALYYSIISFAPFNLVSTFYFYVRISSRSA